MSAWKKRLRAMLEEQPVGAYRYDELARMLDSVGFNVTGWSGSHRTWRRNLKSGIVLHITLVKTVHGPAKPVYVRKMRTLLLGNAEIMAEVNRDE